MSSSALPGSFVFRTERQAELRLRGFVGGCTRITFSQPSTFKLAYARVRRLTSPQFRARGLIFVFDRTYLIEVPVCS